MDSFAQSLEELYRKNDEIITKYIAEFAAKGKPIEVNFRELLPEINGYDRYTHLIHSYPAKLLVHIPYFFLNNTIFSKEGDLVLDPFSGSGTVLLEAMLANRIGLGADANPLARLISEVKVTRLPVRSLKREILAVIQRAKRSRASSIPSVVNREYWFPERTSRYLTRLLRSIGEVKDEAIRNFMLVTFSSFVKKVSYADQNISVPVKLNPKRYERNRKKKETVIRRLSHLENIDIFSKFESASMANINRIVTLTSAVNGNIGSSFISTDARRLTKNLTSDELLPDNSVSMVLTSPPYAGAQKYIRATSLNLGWTELASVEGLSALNQNIIGRESIRKSGTISKTTGFKAADGLIRHISKVNVQRAAVVRTYLTEMKDALDQMIRVLKPNGYLILILGNNRVCGKELNTQKYFSDYLVDRGLKLRFKLIDNIKSYGLMTKRE